MVEKVNAKTFEERTAEGIVVVDFSATWCGPCKMLAPVLEAISEEDTSGVRYLNLDVDDAMEIAQKYRITNIPAVIVMRDQQEIARNVGFLPKDQMLEWIRSVAK